MMRSQACRIGLLFGLLTLAVAAQPLRVLLPPAPMSTTALAKLEPRERIERCVSLYLYERFSEIPQLDVVSEEWTSSLLFEVQSQKRRFVAEDLLKDLQEYVPVDVVITYGGDGENFVFRINARGGMDAKTFPVSLGAAKICHAVGAFVAAQLKFSGADRTALTEIRLPGHAFQNSYLTRRMNTVWVYNRGEKRLDLLRGYLKDLMKYPALAGAVANAGTAMSTDNRKVENVKSYVMLLRMSLPVVLGTPYEDEARQFMKYNRYGAETFEKDFLKLVEPLTKDEIESLDDLADDDAGALGGIKTDPGNNPIVALISGKKTPAQLAGAIRCLGLVKSKKALAFMPRLAAHKDPLIRRAAAFACGQYGRNPEAMKVLEKLSGDNDVRTAFWAGYGLWKLRNKAGETLSHARAVTGFDDTAVPASEALNRLGVNSDVSLLQRLSKHHEVHVRMNAISGLMRLRAADVKLVGQWLNSGNEDQVAAAIAALPEELDDGVRARLEQLANDPHMPLAEEARLALLRFRPQQNGKEQIAYDLAIEHFYIRSKRIDELAQSQEPWAIDMLAAATKNRDPQIRAAAVQKLAARDRARADRELPRLLADPYLWVRLHAALVATPNAATRDAVGKEYRMSKDPVVKVYLRSLLPIRAHKKEPKPVNPFERERTSFGFCGTGEYGAQSPFSYYYNLNTEVSPQVKAAHDKGKCIIGRANNTVKNPLYVMFHPLWKDQWWIGLKNELLAPLPWLDGICLGEESMYFRDWQLWDLGWRVFCIDAGIDPRRVAGDREKLSALEEQAYLNWEEERAIDGFNRIYDFVKLYFGKLRPGFIVNTYMPDQNGPCVADRRWKFDVGGAYQYAVNNRKRYNIIRRYKTLWPDRPMMWLVAGNAGFPYKWCDNGVKYNKPFSTSPVLSRSPKAYADSVTTWLAGAEPGFFVHWLCMTKDTKGGTKAHGKWFHPEDVHPHEGKLGEVVPYMFKGVEKMYEFETKHGKKAKIDDGGLLEGDDDLGIELEDPDAEDRPWKLRVKKEMEAVRHGFLLEQKHLYEVARVFSGLPRPTHAHQVLFVCGPNGMPQFDVAADYDYLYKINELAFQKLDSYRLIGIAVGDKAKLYDETITAVTKWLKEKNGLLYIRGTLSPDNAMEAPRVGNMDGKLENDWPWEKDVALAGKAYKVSGAAKLMKPGVAVWKVEGFRGAAVFDSVTKTADELRDLLNRVWKEYEVGIAVADTHGMQIGAGNAVVGVASTYGALRDYPVTGMELLNGETNPVVRRKRSAAVVAKDTRGTYAAAYNAIAILCEQPIDAVKRIAGGVEISSKGAMRLSTSGELKISAAGKLPTIKAEDLLTWLLETDKPGVGIYHLKDQNRKVYFVRANGAVRATKTK